MSNNREVEYDGDAYFFALEDIPVRGEAELIDKDEFKTRWTEDLQRWFEDGVETVGLVLIKVHASRIHYWDGENEGEFTV
jgi:general stress protein 26